MIDEGFKYQYQVFSRMNLGRFSLCVFGAFLSASQLAEAQFLISEEPSIKFPTIRSCSSSALATLSNLLEISDDEIDEKLLAQLSRIERPVSLAEIAEVLESQGAVHCLGLKNVDIEMFFRMVARRELLVVAHCLDNPVRKDHFVVLKGEKGTVKVFDYPRTIVDIGEQDFQPEQVFTGSFLLIDKVGFEEILAEVRELPPFQKNTRAHKETPARSSDHSTKNGSSEIRVSFVSLPKSSLDGSVVEAIVTIENLSGGELNSMNLKGACSCFREAVGPKNIAAGGQGQYSLRFDGRSYNFQDGISMVATYDLKGKLGYSAFKTPANIMDQNITLRVVPNLLTVTDSAASLCIIKTSDGSAISPESVKWSPVSDTDITVEALKGSSESEVLILISTKNRSMPKKVVNFTIKNHGETQVTLLPRPKI